MRPDAHTRSESAAAEHAALQGRDEDFGHEPTLSELACGGCGSTGACRCVSAPLGPDPWADVWVCVCGSTSDSLPRVCPDCGYQNWGDVA